MRRLVDRCSLVAGTALFGYFGCYEAESSDLAVVGDDQNSLDASRSSTHSSVSVTLPPTTTQNRALRWLPARGEPPAAAASAGGHNW